MSKNFRNQNPSNHDLKTDEGLKARYDELLQAEKEARPAWKDQTFSQKMNARTTGLASTYFAGASVFFAFTPYFFIAPLTFAISADAAKKYDEKVNPEKYYEVKALEKLAIESEKLERPGLKHSLFGGDILGGGIGDYGKKLNAAISDLAPRVGASEGIEYTSPRASLNDLNFATRGINKVVTFAEESASSLVGNATKNYERSSGRIFGSSSPQESAREEEPRPAETLFTRIWNFLFGPSNNNNSRSANYSAPPQPEAPREESKEEDIRQASTTPPGASLSTKRWTDTVTSRRGDSRSFTAIALEESQESENRGSR